MNIKNAEQLFNQTRSLTANEAMRHIMTQTRLTVTESANILREFVKRDPESELAVSYWDPYTK